MTPFLTNLGVAPMHQHHGPTSERMPAALNPANRRTWDAVCDQIVHENDPACAWSAAIRLYVDACVDAGLYPFAPHRQHVNDRIFHDLLAARRLLVRFLNLSKLLKHCTIRSVVRDCEVTDVGFVIEVEARVTLNDPTFVSYLLQHPMPALRLKHNGRYSRRLNDAITVFVYNKHAGASQQWHIGYQLFIQQFPDVPGNHLPSRAEIERFVMNVLFLPVLKSSRPHGYHRRLL